MPCSGCMAANPVVQIITSPHHASSNPGPVTPHKPGAPSHYNHTFRLKLVKRSKLYTVCKFLIIWSFQIGARVSSVTTTFCAASMQWAPRVNTWLFHYNSRKEPTHGYGLLQCLEMFWLTWCILALEMFSRQKPDSNSTKKFCKSDVHGLWGFVLINH